MPPISLEGTLTQVPVSARWCRWTCCAKPRRGAFQVLKVSAPHLCEGGPPMVLAGPLTPGPFEAGPAGLHIAHSPIASCPLLAVSALGPGCNSRVSDGPGDDCLVCFSRQRLGRRRLLELQNRPARTSTTLQTTARCRTESAAPALLLGGSRCVRRTKEGPGTKPPSEPRPGPNEPFGRCRRKFACLFVGQEASDLSGCHSLDGVPRHESQASAGSDGDAMENIPLSSSRTRSSVPNACPDWAVTGVPLSSAV